MSALALQTVRFISGIVSVWDTDSWMEIDVLFIWQQYCASTNYHWESRQTSLLYWKKILFAGIWAVFCRLCSALNLQIKRIALVINLTEVIPEWRVWKISCYLIKWKAARNSPLCWGEVCCSIYVYTSSCRRKCFHSASLQKLTLQSFLGWVVKCPNGYLPFPALGRLRLHFQSLCFPAFCTPWHKTWGQSSTGHTGLAWYIKVADLNPAAFRPGCIDSFFF